jgi:uncharacterized protein (DUF1330 family)
MEPKQRMSGCGRKTPQVQHGRVAKNQPQGELTCKQGVRRSGGAMIAMKKVLARMDDNFGHSFARPHQAAAVGGVKGYWVISVRVIDQARYAAYLEMATDTIDRLGGDMIIRSSDGIVGAGDPKPRIVVVAFPSLAAAREAFESVAQQAAMLMFEGIADYDLTIVEGFVDP